MTMWVNQERRWQGSAGPGIMAINFFQAQAPCHDLSDNGGLFRYSAFEYII